MDIKGNKDKKIKFFKESNKQSYLNFLKNKKINDYETKDEIESNFYYLIKTLFNPVGETDLLLDSSHEFEISDLMWNRVYNGSYIDLVWVNSKKDLKNISFVKVFEEDLSANEYDIFAEEIYNFLDEVTKLYDELKIYLSESKNNSNLRTEKLDTLKNILEKEYEQNDDLKREGSPDYVFKTSLIDFNIYFYFPNSQNDDIEINEEKKYILEKILNIKKNKELKFSSKINIDINSIITEDDLTHGYNENIENILFIEKDYLKIDKENNILKYSNKINSQIEESYIVNISALSLQNLWNKYNNKLLGMNLRLHITNKSVDSEIKTSIENDNDLFWYKNNGLVIICSDIKFKKQNIQLKNFSIINGGQTTFSIGNSSINNDFYLVCKIIVLKDLKDIDNIDASVHEISTEISLSTNNQKPIKKTDKISSISSCRMTKQILWKDFGIFLEIRRGDKPYKKIEQWKKIKAETLQQIYYAFFRLAPGSSRNKVESLFKVENLKDSFENINNELIENVIELMKFWYILNDNAKVKNLKKISFNEIPNNKHLEIYKKQFTTYFKFYSISSLFIMCLMYRNNDFAKWMISKLNYFENSYYSNDKRKTDDEFINELFNYWKNSKIKKIFKYKDVEKIKSNWNAFIFKNMYLIFFSGIKDKNKNDIVSWTNFTKTPDVTFYSIIINIINSWDIIKNDISNLISDGK